jgi:hypothetical protein
MHIRSSSEQQRELTKEVGLRPDTELLMVQVEPGGRCKIQRWNGFVYKERNGWDGPGKSIPADVAESLSLELSLQKLSVALFHVSHKVK